MPIETPHPLYTEKKPKWDRAKDAHAGEDAVKDAGEKYLPKLKDQAPKDYASYKLRAVYFNATGRTVDGMVGMISRKPPEIELPKQLEPMEEEMTASGQTPEEVVKLTAEALIVTGRVGILVDRPEEANESPFLALYAGPEVVNWREDDEGNLELVVLQEGYFEQDPKDPYKLDAKVRYRELAIGDIESGETGEVIGNGYVQRIWEKTQGKKTFEITKTVVPLKEGQPMDAIPFVFVTPKGTNTELYNPPILDIANINIAHYRNSADIEHGRHLTALPTPWVSGLDADPSNLAGSELPLGSGVAWKLPENSQVGFLEFTGTGIKTLADGMDEKEKKMASLGARMIEPPRAGVEAAETARIHQAGDSATLVDVGSSVGEGLEAALKIAAEWEGADPASVSVEMNRDYVSNKLTPQEITALTEAWIKGAISQDTLLKNLKMGEVITDDTTIEEEMKRLEAEHPEAEETEVGGIAANQGAPGFDVERDPDNNVVRLRRSE